MMNKVINVACWTSLGYLIYCAIDRVAMKAEKEGYSKGFESGVSIGKAQGSIETMIEQIKSKHSNEPKEQDQESK